MRDVHFDVKCGTRWHVVSYDGRRLMFPNHRDKTKFGRQVTLAELGNEACGCAKVLVAWRKNDFQDLPEPEVFGVYRLPSGGESRTRRLARRFVGGALERCRSDADELLLELIRGHRFDWPANLMKVLGRMFTAAGVLAESFVDKNSGAGSLQLYPGTSEYQTGLRFAQRVEVANGPDDDLVVWTDQAADDPTPAVLNIGRPCPEDVRVRELGHACEDLVLTKVGHVLENLRCRPEYVRSLWPDEFRSYRDELGYKVLFFLEDLGTIGYSSRFSRPFFSPDSHPHLRVYGVSAMKRLAEQGPWYEKELTRMAALAARFPIKDED